MIIALETSCVQVPMTLCARLLCSPQLLALTEYMAMPTCQTFQKADKMAV